MLVVKLLLFQVPTVIMDAHTKHVKEAVDSNADDPVKVGLEKSGIAGTEPSSNQADNEEDKKDDKPTENGDSKKDDSMDVRLFLLYTVKTMMFSIVYL